MMPDARARAHRDHRSGEIVSLARQGLELGAGFGAIPRLVEPAALARQDLVGAEHDGIGHLGRDPLRLELGKRDRSIAGRHALRPQGLLQR